jgi:HK97 family phage prohead protease
VQWLLNHGGLSMAYTRAGTLRLAEDSTGLQASRRPQHRRTDVQDMVLAIERGNVDEMSFAFRVPAGKSIWSPDYDQRDILEVDIHRGDVSTVNFGANPNTTSDARPGPRPDGRGRRPRAVRAARPPASTPQASALPGAAEGPRVEAQG